MDVLTTRVLSYSDGNGTERELNLTIFVPFEEREGLWKCGFVFGPPLPPKVQHGAGVDFIQAFILCLHYARAYIKTWDEGRRAHWQGMPDCGLVESVEGPATVGPAGVPPPERKAGNMDVLTTRRLGFPGEGGVEGEILLTIFVPFKEGERWKCGFTFDPPESALVDIYYGVGEDFIEALLDGLAMARASAKGFEGEATEGWEGSEDLLDCAGFPYKGGRSFLTSRDG